MANYQTKLIQKETIAEETMAFHLERPSDFIFEAGQTIDITIENPAATDEKGNSRTFSISSAPHENYLEVATRMRDSAFKNTLREMPEESALSMEGPFGSFTLHENETRPAVFLVGGIGITPFRSMIRDAQHRNLSHQMYLFYSNRRPEDASYLDELMTLKESCKTLSVIPTMTETDKSSEMWDGEEGYVTYDMISKYVKEGTAPIFYMAGPQGMVLAMEKLLIEAGISKDDIKFEEFPGY